MVGVLKNTFVKLLSSLNGRARLTIAIGISVLIHLVIIYGVNWFTEGSARAAYPNKIPNERHRLTVTLALPVQAVSQDPQHVAAEKFDVDSEKNSRADATTAEFSSALGLRYFTLDELDQRPDVVEDISQNPPELLAHEQGGEIVLRLWISEAGKVENVEMISSNLPQVFIDSARNNFLRATFLPGKKFGIPVPSIMDVKVNYLPEVSK